MDTYKNLGLLIILILLSGFFSASETALTSFKSNNLEKLEEEGKLRKVELLKKWLKNSNEMLTGLLVGNNIVNILASSIATVVTIGLMGGKPTNTSIFISTVGMTVVILIFGEITPKIIAKTHSVKIASIVVTFIYYLSIVLKPIVKILMWISKFIGRMLGIEIQDEGIMITEEDIISFVNVGEAEGIIEEEEKEMIHSIVGFGEITAKEVMTPRTSMLAFESHRTLDDVWEEMIENGFSRIPVYEDTIDNIIGVLYVKDVLAIIKSGKLDIPIKNFVREAYFVPETKSIIEILQHFREIKVHIALVLDEYGGVVGVVTIEDLIEEITGEIRDEYDTEEEEEIKKIDDIHYEIDGMLDIDSLNEELSISLPESEDYESLGGLIVTTLGKVAEVNDEVKIGDVKLIVKEVDKKRVAKVLLEIENEEGEKNNAY